MTDMKLEGCAVCTHCGRVVGNVSFRRHVRICPMRTDLREQYQVVLSKDDKTIVPVNVYDVRHKRNKNLASSAMLRRFFGGWEGVAAYFELQYDPDWMIRQSVDSSPKTVYRAVRMTAAEALVIDRWAEANLCTSSDAIRWAINHALATNGATHL